MEGVAVREEAIRGGRACLSEKAVTRLNRRPACPVNLQNFEYIVGMNGVARRAYAGRMERLPNELERASECARKEKKRRRNFCIQRTDAHLLLHHS